MALCDQLEAARTEREATRNRLAAASLDRLNAPDPDPTRFQNHAAFALENFTPLTIRPDQIKAFRQTILNLAIHGKLVPQEPTDEPASMLLERIAFEKARMVNPSVAEILYWRVRSARHTCGFLAHVACSSSSPSVKLNHRLKWPGIEEPGTAPRRAETM